MLAWMGNAAILISIWRLGNKHRDAWLWSIAGNGLWAAFGIQQDIWSIVFLDGLMFALAYHNWRKWK